MNSTKISSTPTPHLYELTYRHFYALPIVAVVSYIIYQRIFSPLAKIPGPFWASLSRWWLVATVRQCKYHEVAQALHAKYGHIVRIAPDEVSISDLSAMKQIYSGGTRFQKSDFYSVLKGPRKFDIFAGQDEKVHGQQRKLVARAYTMETLKDLEPYVDKSIAVFNRKINEVVGKTVDMGNWFQLFAFDVIGEMTWSTSFGFLDAGQDDGTFGAITTMAKSAAWVAQVPWVWRIHQRLMPYIGNHLGVNARNGGLREFAIRETAKRAERPVEKQDMIGRFFEVSAQKPDELTYEGVINTATSNISAGSDTTAITLRAIIYYLLKNPETMKKLVAEIDDLRRRGELSNPVTFAEANKLKYLQAVIQEGLRIHPAIGMNLPRVVPSEGAEICGHFLPGGNIVGVNAYVVNRNKDVYGQDSDQFRPDRWLQEDTSDMSRYLFSFGMGSRACIGRNISMMEMSKLIPTTLLNYTLEFADPSKDWDVVCTFFAAQKGLNVKLNPRADPAESV